MSLKINDITNLQDARFCAAEEVEYVSFVLDRSSIYRIEPEAISEILCWLSGVQTIVDVGDDFEAWEEWQNLDVKSDYVQIGLKLRAKLTEPKALFFLKVDSDKIDEEWFNLAQYIEIPYSPMAASKADNRVFLHTNHWREIDPIPTLLSTDLSLQADIHSLDYDVFDELKAICSPFKYGLA